jgi:5-methyltetrahydrofolate--homocysteine methyltransferase
MAAPRRPARLRRLTRPDHRIIKDGRTDDAHRDRIEDPTTVIGFDQPFCVIGERINPTGRKKLNAELERGDFSRSRPTRVAQVAAGATVLDVNSGAVFSNKMGDPRYADNNFVEPPLMPELIELVQAVTDVPLCIDSSVPGALEAGLEAARAARW